MRYLLRLLPLLIFISCASPQRAAFTTIAATQKAVKLSYDGYVDQVIQGKLPDADLPVVADAFDAFQATSRVAIARASGDTNAPVTPDLLTAADKVYSAIQKGQAKPKK